MRDVTLGDTIYFKFTTRAFATGIPTQLAGTPSVSIYSNDSVTQLGPATVATPAAGITLAVDFDSVTGLNHVTVVATGGNGYADDTDYYIVISAGTVATVSCVGEVVGEFSVQRSPVNWANVTTPATAVNLSATNIDVDQVVASVTGAVGSVTTKTGYELAATGADLILSSSTFAAAMADAILLRNASNVETTAGEHTLCTVILAMMEHSISGTTLTIKRTDGVTTHATKTLTVNAAADPITGIT